MSKTTTTPRFLSWPQTVERTGISKPTIWRLHRAGKFPKPVVLEDTRRSLFIESEVDAWIASRIAARDSRAA